MTVEEILAIMSLAERGITSVQKIMEMRQNGVSDQAILDEIARLRQLHDRHQSLDLRTPQTGQ